MPRVSIGLPVYNGEDYVGEAVESLVAQTFTDFELVIVDNASTDKTGEICRAVAARDPRVRYQRNDRNIGGGPNQNLAFSLANAAPYFKWAAHDDVHAPRFLERCVEVLDRDPSVVNAFCQVELIDAQGKHLGARKATLPLDSYDVLERYQALLPSYDCLEMFGVMRRSTLPDVPVGLYSDGDCVLLARVALQGRFVEVPETLFYNRRHATQAGTKYDGNPREWATWWDPQNTGRRVFPQWRRQAELWKSLAGAPIPLKDRARCAVALARWTNWRRGRLMQDVNFHVNDFLKSLGRSRDEKQGPSAR
jgi:glycosyltransferase involved in cell wall biosynthesis